MSIPTQWPNRQDRSAWNSDRPGIGPRQTMLPNFRSVTTSMSGSDCIVESPANQRTSVDSDPVKT